jgi:hypothetical protein
MGKGTQVIITANYDGFYLGYGIIESIHDKVAHIKFHTENFSLAYSFDEFEVAL